MSRFLMQITFLSIDEHRLWKATNKAERAGTIPVHSDKTCGNGTLAKLLLPIEGHLQRGFRRQKQRRGLCCCGQSPGR